MSSQFVLGKRTFVLTKSIIIHFPIPQANFLFSWVILDKLSNFFEPEYI